jgi:hypothetical protein
VAGHSASKTRFLGSFDARESLRNGCERVVSPSRSQACLGQHHEMHGHAQCRLLRLSFDSSQLFLLIAGVACTVVGGLIVFSNRFLSLLDRTLWMRAKFDEALFTKDSAYVFNRYGRGWAR